MIKNKIVTLFLLGSLSLQGDLLEDRISNIIDQEKFEKHKNLVDEIITNKEILQDDQAINYNILLKNLKDKGLLNTSLPEQTDVRVVFNILNSNKKGFKIVKEILSNIGYSYYFTDFIQSSENNLLWQIHFKSDFALDPQIFSEELSKFKTTITDLNKLSQTEWEYKIDARNGTLFDVQNVTLNEELALTMPFAPYIIALPKAKDLLIASSKANNWIPKISFYDQELNALGTIEMDRVYEGIKVAIPNNTRYVKISDRYTLLNLKRGLSILASNGL